MMKQLKDKIEHDWETTGNKKWIIGIDGRKLYSRSKHSLVNLLFQSTGAIIVDYALCLFDMKMGSLYLDEKGRPYYKYKGKVVKRVGYFHDEANIETNPEVTEEVAKIMEWCMVEAGKKLKLNVPLIGEAKIGLNWSNTH
jgi:DNA polymerase-1